MQYTVKKPINNNILRVVDPTGCELIVTGRGLGFGVKPGNALPLANIPVGTVIHNIELYRQGRSARSFRRRFRTAHG